MAALGYVSRHLPQCTEEANPLLSDSVLPGARRGSGPVVADSMSRGSGSSQEHLSAPGKSSEGEAREGGAGNTSTTVRRAASGDRGHGAGDAGDGRIGISNGQLRKRWLAIGAPVPMFRTSSSRQPVCVQSNSPLTDLTDSAPGLLTLVCTTEYPRCRRDPHNSPTERRQVPREHARGSLGGAPSSPYRGSPALWCVERLETAQPGRTQEYKLRSNSQH